MKALTIIQPWATLIASGHKMNETRSWKTNYRGEVLIHAGKNPKDYTSGCYIDDPDGRYLQDKEEKGMENDKIHDYTDAYLESYLRALDKTHNPDLAIQTAMGVTMVLKMIDAQNEPKQPAQPQINPMAALFGAMMQQAAQNQQEEGSEIESDDDE